MPRWWPVGVLLLILGAGVAAEVQWPRGGNSQIGMRVAKERDKALAARVRYDALVGLERAYWAALAREGLTQKVEHVSSGEGR